MRRRIAICLGLLLALCLVGDAIAMLCLYRSSRELTHIADSHRIQSMRTDLASSGVRIESNLLAYLDGHGDGSANPEDAVRRFRESQRQCTTCHHDKLVQEDLIALDAASHAYDAAARELVARDANRAGPVQKEPHYDQFEQNVERLAGQLVKRATNLSDRAATHLSFRSAGAASSVRNAWIALSGTLIGALVIGGVVALHLQRHLTRPIASLLEGIEQARQGVPSRSFSFDADEEFRVLAHAFDEAYESIDSAHARFAQAEKLAAVGRLAAGVAHEVANPLASVSAIVQVMRRRSSSDAQDKQFALIMQEIARISRTIRQLLTFSRPAEGAIRAAVDVGALLDRTTSLLAYDQRAKHVRLSCRYADLPTVWGDADQLLLLFTNIALNAFDAVDNREDGQGSLTIRNDRDGDSVVVHFEDNGPGMNEEQIAKAFEPFYTTKEPGVGTGLGLWVSYRVVQQHNGTIELNSRQGKGTTVTVRLPCGRSPEPAPAANGDGI